MFDVADDDFEKSIRWSGYPIAFQHLLKTAHLVLEPLQMRGFGYVKLDNIEQARGRAAALSSRLSGRDLAVKLFTP